MPDLVQPLNIETEITSSKSPGLLSNAFGPGAHIMMQSRVSCIKISKNYYSQPTDVDSTVSHALYPLDVYFSSLTKFTAVPSYLHTSSLHV